MALANYASLRVLLQPIFTLQFISEWYIARYLKMCSLVVLNGKFNILHNDREPSKVHGFLVTGSERCLVHGVPTTLSWRYIWVHHKSKQNISEEGWAISPLPTLVQGIVWALMLSDLAENWC